MATYYEAWLEELLAKGLKPPESVEERCWKFFKWMCLTHPQEIDFPTAKDEVKSSNASQSTLHAEVERLNLIISGKTFFSEVDAALAKGRLEGAEAMKNEMMKCIFDWEAWKKDEGDMKPPVIAPGQIDPALVAASIQRKEKE